MIKRLLALCLTLVLLLSMLPAGASAAVITSSVNTGYNTATATASQSALFSTAYVRNTMNGPNRTPQRIEAVVNLESGGTSTQLVYAVVMLAADFDARYSGTGLTQIGNTTYAGLQATASYYAIGAHSKGTGTTLTLPFYVASTANAGILQTDGTPASNQRKSMPKSPVGTSFYHEEYVLVVFAHDAEGQADRYYVDRFYMDAEGYVLTPSYGVRYNENNPPVASSTYTVGSMPTNGNSSNNRTFYQRAAWSDSSLGTGIPGSMTLSDATPTRTGYKFVGWTDQPLDPLAEGATAPTTDGATVTSGGSSATFYRRNGTYPQPSTLNQVYNLYALWQVVPVKFSHTGGTSNGVTYTVSQEGTDWILDWPVAPQVGVPLSSGNILYAQPDGSTKQPYGAKTFQITHYQGSTLLGTTTAAYNDISVGKLGNNHTWGFMAANGPKNHTYKEDGTSENYRMVITVTDPSNNTYDTITVRFPKIEKREQPVPTKDVNTGLQSQVEELKEEQLAPLTPEQKALLADGNKDGQILGFYSGGATGADNAAKNAGYLPIDSDPTKGTNGTGTMTNYYLNLGMVFEYRPKTVGGTDVSYASVPGEGGAETNRYATMPNDGWREIPFPSGRYASDDLAKIQAAGALNAKTVQYSTLADSAAATKAVVTDKTDGASAAFKDETSGTGWLDEYGWIDFNASGLPVVHGLKDKDVYEVRFRANATSAVSPAAEIPIGGAVAASSTTGGGGLAVNLVGGKVTDAQQADFNTFVNTCHAMKPGDSVTIPDITPEKENYEFGGWTMGEFDTETNKLVIYEKDAVVTLGDKPSSLAAVWNSTTGGFAALIFYDWDETLLGSVIVPRGDATTYVEAYQNTMIASEDEIKKTADGSDDADGTKYLWYSDAKIAADVAANRTPKYLSNKKGYNFDAWLLNSSDTFTASPTALPKYDGTNDAAAEAAGVANFTNVTGSMVLKASYVENETCNAGLTGNAARYYTMTDPTYNRYAAAAATTGDYSVRFSIERENSEGYGVTRLRDPSIRVRVAPDFQGAQTSYVYELYHLDNTDTTEIELALPKMARSALYTVIEVYNVPAWTGQSVSATARTISKNTGTVTNTARNDKIGTDGWVKEGTLTYINEQCIAFLNGEDNYWTNRCNAQAFLDAGLTPTLGTAITTAQATSYRTAIQTAIEANGRKPLNYDQLRSALGLPAIS